MQKTDSPTMITEISKQYFEFCSRAYEEQPDRKAFTLPDWISNLRTESQTAQTAHVCVQAAVVSMIKNTGSSGRLAGMSFDDDITPASFVASLAAVLKMNAEGGQGPLADALFSLSEYLGYANNLGDLPKWDQRTGEPNPLHALATEASERDAAAVTPVDVTRFMFSLAGAKRVHAYALDGLGLLYGVDDEQSIWSVGEELGSGRDHQLPSPLANIYAESRVLIQAPEFTNRAFLDLELLARDLAPPADALLVNASRWAVPFYPSGQDDDPAPSDAGALNHCLTAGYQQVVVLVSNHSLTAGRGRAAKILQHCLQHGLQQVIQLPKGVLGLRSQAHSILVFDKAPNTGEVKFVTLSEDANSRNATKGFGQPRRARRLQVDDQISPEQSFTESASTLLERNNGNGSARGQKLLSFEVGQFAKKDAFEPLRGRYEFMRLGAFMDVFRSHHILETGDASRDTFNEIGSVNITSEGSILLGRIKDCPSESLQQRRAQVLLDEDVVVCFRGSPDSFGKVGLYRHKPGVTAIPNQSFVIIRRKIETPANAPSPAHVLWWLRSAYAQRYLQEKAIAPDVMRITPREIDAIEVPCGPAELLETEIHRLNRAEKSIQTINELREEVATLLNQAWL
jgi:hypothetical protein